MGGAILSFLICISSHAERAHPHLDLEMTGAEYESLISRRAHLKREDGLDEVLKLGKRNLDWLKVINQNRVGAPLSFSAPGTQVGIPIETPRENSPAIVMSRFGSLLQEMDSQMKAILEGVDPLPTTLPLTESEYLKWGLKVDGVYQSASRWILQEPFIQFYIMNRVGDIRGYYFLTRVFEVEKVLESWGSLSPQLQDQYTQWLIGLCINQNDGGCGQELQQLLASVGHPRAYFEKYLPAGKEAFEKYFRIDYPRKDLRWSSSRPDLLSAPFIDPKSQEIRDFLRVNIEDEWRWTGWRLTLNFTSGDPDKIPSVTFKPGVTPNVEYLGGNRITMDANQPLTEYNVKWTIRHEYGHVLGLPDCYVEFFDDVKQVMINYQIDTDNIMCSRRGKFLSQHFDELKRVYYK